MTDCEPRTRGSLQGVDAGDGGNAQPPYKSKLTYFDWIFL